LSAPRIELEYETDNASSLDKFIEASDQQTGVESYFDRM